MKKQTTTTTTSWNYPTLCNPEAHIAVKNNRMKHYEHEGENRIYLEDGTEFELEFYNNSGDYVKADITVNGKKQSSALVLRPYQRFYLDRFMDEKKKFKFNTFMTGNDDIEKLKEIIEKNGRIKVEFYQEIKPLPITWTTTVQETFDSHLYDNTLDGGGTGNPIFPDTLTFDGNQSRGMSSGGNKSLSKSVNCCNYSANIGMKNEPEEIESGRIESGKKSKQDFVTTDRQFSMFAAATFEYHIMPISHKPKKAKRRDVIIADDIRTYCPGCGRRLKKGWNFCAGCGHRF
jgi:hypothetical protein